MDDLDADFVPVVDEDDSASESGSESGHSEALRASTQYGPQSGSSAWLREVDATTSLRPNTESELFECTAAEEYESAELSVSIFAPREIRFALTPGTWRLDAWIPQGAQGPLKNHRVIGKLTGNAVRQLAVSARVVDATSAPVTMLVRTTKSRESIYVEIPPGRLSNLVLRFETRAVLFPLVFAFKLAAVNDHAETPRAPAVRFLPERYSLDWLEHRFNRLPIEDKIRFAKAVADAQARGWPSLQGACAATYDNTMGVCEMARESVYKAKARSLGLIRPFLLLVSMHPGRRAGWALSLNINIVRGARFGDPHWEAFEVLTHKRNGVVARARHTFREKANPLSRDLDWYQLLHRVLFVLMSTRRAGILRVLQKERMDGELLQELKDAKVDKSVSKGLSQDEMLGASPASLENLFARQFFTARADAIFPEGVFHIPACSCDDADPGSEVTEEGNETAQVGAEASASSSAPACVPANEMSREDFRKVAVDIVANSPELSAKAQLLRKHGFADETHIAIAVLSAYRRAALPVAFHSAQSAAEGDASAQAGLAEENASASTTDDKGGRGLCASWNAQWGSQNHLYEQEFQDTVRTKMRQEGNTLNVTTAAGMMMPLILTSLSITPGAVGAVFIARAAVKRIYKDLPASLAAILSGLVLQRYWLALDDVALEPYYSCNDVVADDLGADSGALR